MDEMKRPTLSEILAHPWTSGEEPNLFKLCSETYIRKELYIQTKLTEPEMNEDMTCDSTQSGFGANKSII